MHKAKSAATAVFLFGAVAVIAGCSTGTTAPIPGPTNVTAPPAQAPVQTPVQTPPQTEPTTPKQPSGTTGTPAGGKTEYKVASKPNDITVLVNKSIMLPDGYVPPDLTEPNVPFIFKEKDDKRLMRAEAAHALESLVAAAKKDGVFLAGVSGYRSYQTQVGLFNYYVQTQGEETARKYSAEPGHSEHQTGLAMDVSGSTGECAADDCFAGTPEANWLAQHASEHGFIIRYPKGKEAITGYAYEPWHLRYVGKTMASAIASKGLTLEEYLGQTK